MKKTPYCLLFSFFLVHICHSCLNIKLQNVNFNATNFEYMLQWSKNNLPQDVVFSVQCIRYGHNRWLLVPLCENITNTSCNLTDAIIGDVEDFMENEYYGRVRASYRNCSSNWIMSKRLNPREDTYIVLPRLSYTQYARSIMILVLTPSVTNKNKDGQPITVEDLYRDKTFKYHLRIFSPEKQEPWSIIQTERKFEISGLNPSTEYNGSVYIMIGDKRKSDIQYFAVKTLPDLSLVTLISILTTVSAAMLSAVLLYLCCKYINQQAKTPSSLNLPKLRSNRLMSLPMEKYSSCSMRYSPTMILQLHDPHILQEQSGSDHPISYVSQLQTSASETVSTLLIQTSIYKHQNNCNIAHDGHYGDLFEDINSEYRSKPTHNIFNKTSYKSQMELQDNVRQPLSDENGGKWNGLKNTTGSFNFSLLKLEPNDGLDLKPSLGLMSTLVMGGMSEFMAQEKQTEKHLSFTNRLKY